MSDTTFGYGHETPNDSGSDYRSVLFLARQVVAKISTMTPVKVLAVTAGAGTPPAAGTVDVQPLISQIDGNGYGTPHGTVHGIPWSRIQGGKNAIICDPVVGDIGFIVAASRDMSKVKNTKAAALPGSRRRYNLADSVYVGAILNPAPTCYIQFTADGHLKFVDVDGNMVVSSSTGWSITPKSGQPVTINGALVVTQNFQLGGTIQSEAGGTYFGNIVLTGTVTAADVVGGGKSLATHVHSGVQTGGGDSGPPV